MTPDNYGEIAEYCPVCAASICLRKDGTFRVHGPLSARCAGSRRLSQIATPAPRRLWDIFAEADAGAE